MCLLVSRCITSDIVCVDEILSRDLADGRGVLRPWTADAIGFRVSDGWGQFHALDQFCM